MTAAQVDVDDVMSIGVSGQVADLHTDEFGATESLVNTEASLSIGFGVLAKRDGIGGVKETGANTDDLAGVTMFERVYDFPSERDDVGPLPGLPMTLLRRGRILVQTLDAVTAETGEVHVWHGTEDRTADPPVLKGSFQGAASAGNTYKLPGGIFIWRTTTGAAGIAELEVNLPLIAGATAPTADS